MKRRGFFGALLGAPVVAAAAVAGWAPDKADTANGALRMDLGASPFPGALRVAVDCDFGLVPVLDALSLVPQLGEEIMLVVGHQDSVNAKEVREDLEGLYRVSITINTHRAWQDGRWAMRCGAYTVYSPGA